MSGVLKKYIYLFCNQKPKDMKNQIDYKENKTMELTIIERNVEFNKLKTSDKRLVVVQDALDSVINEIITPKQNKYCEQYSYESEELDIMTNPDIKCEACAIGTMLISTCRFTNELTYSDVSYKLLWNKSLPNFTSIFTDEQLFTIERCFEKDLGNESTYINNFHLNFPRKAEKINEVASQYRKAFPQVLDRMVAIFHNMLRNNGIFIPGDDLN